MTNAEFGRKAADVDRREGPFYIESLESARQAVARAMEDHIVSLTATTIHETLAVADIVRPSRDEDAYCDAIITQHLNRLIRSDIERHPELCSGEVQVSGNGIALGEYDHEASIYPVEILEEGCAWRGLIDDHVVMPTLAYNAYTRYIQTEAKLSDDAMIDDGDIEPWSLCVVLRDVKVIDTSGLENDIPYNMIVPLAYPSLSFDAIIRQQASEHAEREPDMPLIDVTDCLLNDQLYEDFTDIENDLNYNEYDGETAGARRAEYQEQLEQYIHDISNDDALLLMCDEVRTPAGDTLTLFTSTDARLEKPIIVETAGKWRIVYRFTATSSDQTEDVVFVVPENIIAACKQSV